MTQTSHGFDLDTPRPWLRPATWAYGIGRRGHQAIYDLGILKRRKLSHPVICIGNLTVGGTGKTPMLISLARELIAQGKRPVVLSRGYHAEPKAVAPRVVSDGNQLKCEPDAAGDEPHLIARMCPGVPVVIGSNRYESGKLAEREWNPDCFLLDDGFQHEPLERDVNLVLWDMRDRPDEMRLLPEGRLRESLKGLRRATAILLTHAEYLKPEIRADETRRIVASLKRYAPSSPIFDATAELAGWRQLQSLNADSALNPAMYQPMESLRGRSVFLASALARSGGFESMIRESAANVVGHASFPDHAKFTTETLQSLRAQAQTQKAEIVLVTEKDAVKIERLSGNLADIAAVGLSMRLDPMAIREILSP